MAQVIIVSSEKTFVRSLQVQITNDYGLECLVFQDEVQAISMISLLSDIKIIITSEKYHKKICNYFVKDNEAEQIPVVVVGSNTSTYSNAISLPINSSVKKIAHHVGFLLKLEEQPSPEEEVKEQKIESQEAPVAEEKTTVFVMPKIDTSSVTQEEVKLPRVEYSSINIKFLFHLKKISVDFDIYSRIKKGENFEYNIKIAAHSSVSEAEFERIKLRGGKEIFVKKEDLEKAQNFFGTSYLNRFKDPKISLMERMSVNSESYDILLDVFKDSSFTKYSIEIIKELINSFSALLNSPEPLQAFFTGIKSKELSYGYMHSYLTCLLTLKVIEAFPWKNNQSKNKIIYLALFHDLCLHNNRLIKLHHNYFNVVEKLTEQEKTILINHADAAATILEKIVKAPKELTLIIREHHGLKQGHGFVADLSLSIGPLNMVFIVIEDFVTLYLDFWENSNQEIVSEFVKLNPKDILSTLSVKYHKLTYLEAVTELEKMFKD